MSKIQNRSNKILFCLTCLNLIHRQTLSIVSGFLRTGNTPGLGQRIGFGFYFLWIGYLAFLLFKQEEIKTPTNI